MATITAPFAAPPGWAWIFCARFWHVGAKRYLYARDYGKRAWCLLVRARRNS